MSSLKWFGWLGVLFVAAAVTGGATDEIVGTWRGSSVCTDRAAAPACTDEQVVYEISTMPGKANMVKVQADKIVNGKREPMGDLDFTRDADGSGWTTEILTPRVHATLRLVVRGTRMDGVMTLLPAKAVVRKIELQKEH